jgi:hypothetical protein
MFILHADVAQYNSEPNKQIDLISLVTSKPTCPNWTLWSDMRLPPFSPLPVKQYGRDVLHPEIPGRYVWREKKRAQLSEWVAKARSVMG